MNQPVGARRVARRRSMRDGKHVVKDTFERDFSVRHRQRPPHRYQGAVSIGICPQTGSFQQTGATRHSLKFGVQPGAMGAVSLYAIPQTVRMSPYDRSSLEETHADVSIPAGATATTEPTTERGPNQSRRRGNESGVWSRSRETVPNDVRGVSTTARRGEGTPYVRLPSDEMDRVRVPTTHGPDTCVERRPVPTKTSLIGGGESGSNQSTRYETVRTAAMMQHPVVGQYPTDRAERSDPPNTPFTTREQSVEAAPCSPERSRPVYSRSNRSSSITFAHASTKS